MHTVPVHGGLLLESCSVQRIEVMTGAKVGQKVGDMGRHLCQNYVVHILYFIYNPISDLCINYLFINQLSIYIPHHCL